MIDFGDALAEFCKPLAMLQGAHHIELQQL
jgi:hypothetical protein